MKGILPGKHRIISEFESLCVEEYQKKIETFSLLVDDLRVLWFSELFRNLLGVFLLQTRVGLFA